MAIIPADDRGRNTSACDNIAPMQDVRFVATDRDGSSSIMVTVARRRPGLRLVSNG